MAAGSHLRRGRQEELAGKIAEARALITAFPAEVEADLAQYYPGEPPLSEVYIPGRRLTFRRLSVLLAQLPEDSRLATKMRIVKENQPGPKRPGPKHDPADDRWSKLEMLVATLIDEFRFYRHDYRGVHTKGGNAGPAPEPVGRPGIRMKRKPYTMSQRMMLDPRMRGDWPTE